MALTRDFKATVQARVQADPAFRDALLHESIETLLGGDVDTGKAILRDYIKATVRFEKLGAETGSSAKASSACSVQPATLRRGIYLRCLGSCKSMRGSLCG